jgi:hypothetical protein
LGLAHIATILGGLGGSAQQAHWIEWPTFPHVLQLEIQFVALGDS